MGSEYEESRDIISNLPDELLCHILSFLPTKFAVGTSILSKRWRYLWASVPILDFDDELWLNPSTLVELEERIIMFQNFVDGVLRHSEVSCIKKFRLGYRDNNLDSVYSWICIALERRVQELDLHLLIDWGVELPPMFFICKTLVVVKLSCALFLDIPTTVWLPSLKALHLKSVEYSDDDSIQKLLSGCPVLEELVIEREERDNQWVVNVSNPSLKILRIFFFTDGFAHPYEQEDQDYKVVVDAPNLEYLSITDYLSKDYFVKDLPSLVKAFIDVEQDSEEFEESPHNGGISYHGPIYELLGRISNVKCLSLTGVTLDVSFLCPPILPTFHNMTCLEFLFIGGFNWDFLPNFLHSSPNLEALVIETVCKYPM
uniref:F-box domain-containing protein n=1 Tax=Vitis vinifera TaxID=29760 RepID=F6HR85_VITVI